MSLQGAQGAISRTPIIVGEMGEEHIAKMAEAIPMKKIGHVNDIANAALFLASKEAGYITGQTIIIDGGQILPES